MNDPLPNEQSPSEPSRDEIDALTGVVVIEFGASWCGHCLAAQPKIAAALNAFPVLRHIRIEDGPGRRLGRSFRVKLWPTLIVLKNGVEVNRLVRPQDSSEIQRVFRNVLAG